MPSERPLSGQGRSQHAFSLTEARRAVAQFVRDRAWLWDLIHPSYAWIGQQLRNAHVRRVFAGRLPPSEAAGQTLLSEAMARGAPLGVGKIGGLEAELAGFFLTGRQLGKPYPTRLRAQVFLNVGLFPDTDDSLDRFCAALIAALADIDILGLIGYAGEAKVIQSHAPNAQLIPWGALDPWHFSDPWSRHLADRRVTVVSPFAQSIERQYRRRSEIWPGTDLLPAFTLRTVRMPLSPGLRPPQEPDWESRLSQIIAAIEAEPYDVLLIGAGGLSLLLAAHARRTGRIGFHMGGPTQILFGVRGRRWDEQPFFQRTMNAAWVRPDSEDTPPETRRIENGCYW